MVIRFAGDSGDGMQLTGTQFGNTAAALGNDLATLPDFPAEIRAPAGTLAGVSGFQLQFASHDVFTPGDGPDVLVAMNAAALKANLPELKRGAVVIANVGGFDETNLKKAGLASNPLEDGSLDGFKLYTLDVTRLTRECLKGSSLNTRAIDRSKNFFALGLMYWMYNRPMETTLQWLRDRFKNQPDVLAANEKVLQAGHAYGETTEMFEVTYRVPKAQVAPGTYRNITGNTALAWGLIAASKLAGIDLFHGAYPITPASDVLHELSRHKAFGVVTFQAEDEIAGVAAAIGAAFGGKLAVTTSSGPGIALKTEAIGLATMAELPLVIINVQRGGPSTGLPTKTEQADLLQAMFGRNSEAPLPILAPATPGDCFHMAIEAARIAIKYMVPVFLLSDGYLANGAEPWPVPKLADLPRIPVTFRTDPEGFSPYQRAADTLARPWAIPGTPGLEHRIGGLEKHEHTGSVSYDPVNHERMVKLREAKVAGIAADVPDLEVNGDASGDLLVLGWGSTYGAITAAVSAARARGLKVSSAHLRHLNPFPRNLEQVLRSYGQVLIPELNMGQLRLLIQARFVLPTIGLSKVQGQPLKVSEVLARIEELARSH